MKDRLLQFISEESLSPAKFADEIGVQRSSISHVLSGRNNPGYEFIQRILKRFPSLNADWLILGTGSMYKPVIQASLFETKDNVSKSLDATLFDTHQVKTKPDLTDVSAATPISGSEKLNSGQVKIQPEKKTSSSLERIVIFYTDHTFEEYVPGIGN